VNNDDGFWTAWRNPRFHRGAVALFGCGVTVLSVLLVAVALSEGVPWYLAGLFAMPVSLVALLAYAMEAATVARADAFDRMRRRP
jgi:hypothetical protein